MFQKLSRRLQAISKLTTSEKSRAAIAQVMRYDYISSEETDSDVDEAAQTQLQRRPRRVRRLQHESPRLRAIKNQLDTIYFDDISTPLGKHQRASVARPETCTSARSVPTRPEWAHQP